MVHPGRRSLTSACTSARPESGRAGTGARKATTKVAAGGPSEGYPTFADGHRLNVIADAVLLSDRERRWVDVDAGAI